MGKQDVASAQTAGRNLRMRRKKMKTNGEYMLREIAGEAVLIPTGLGNICCARLRVKQC